MDKRLPLLFIVILFSNLLFSNEGRVCDSIVINNIIYEGNNKTKITVIQRELLIKPLDIVTSKELDKAINESVINLKNLSIFNFITIDTLHNYNIDNMIDIRVNVVERWYFWPNPKLTFADRNINAWLKTCDWSKINFGFVFVHNNLWGLNHTASITTLYGYNSVLGFVYSIPFFDTKKILGINLITENTVGREVSYLTSKTHKIQYLHQTGITSQQTQKYGVEVVLRPKFKTTHTFGVNYNSNHVADTILVLNPNYSPADQAITQYFTLYYKLKFDKRDYRHYPLKGSYIDAVLSRSGLGILNLEKAVKVTSIATSARQYFRLANRWHYSIGLITKITLENNQPYIFTSGLGSTRVELRGYESYAIDGTNYLIFKNNAKYTILKNHVFNVKGVNEKWGKFNLAIYGNVFFDMGYVEQNYMQPRGIYNNKFLYAGGIGIDFVTYYDKVLRVDATINREGKFGVYLHFTAPI